jgi:hypothetical protein
MSHYYFDPVSKSYFPSVTTILQNTLPEPPALAAWRKNNKNWKKLLTVSQINGTLIHFAILNRLSDNTQDPRDLPPMWKWYPDTADKIDLAVCMFYEMLEHEKISLGYPRMIEHKIINSTEKYAGKYDMKCKVNGVETLMDLKTSAQVRDQHLLQLGGYYAAIPDKDKPTQAGVITVHVDPKNNPSLVSKIHILPEHKVISLSEEFIELARTFHKLNIKPKDGISEID